MRDDAFGHRDPISGRETGLQGRSEVPWTPWDHALIAAYQFIESFTDEHGLHAWEVADEAVEVDAIRKTNKFLASRDQVTSKKNYKALPGEYFIPRVRTRRDSGEYWTPTDWFKYETDKIEADNPSE